jgi:hypothetical protein
MACLCVILWHAVASTVAVSEVVLHIGVALFCGPAVTSSSLFMILWHTLAFVVADTEVILRCGMSLPRLCRTRQRPVRNVLRLDLCRSRRQH